MNRLAAPSLLLSLAFTLLLAGFASPGFGQLREQTFQLNAGWNTVFLEVDPVPRRPLPEV